MALGRRSANADRGSAVHAEVERDTATLSHVAAVVAVTSHTSDLLQMSATSCDDTRC